jgi:hypothetical protein
MGHLFLLRLPSVCVVNVHPEFCLRPTWLLQLLRQKTSLSLPSPLALSPSPLEHLHPPSGSFQPATYRSTRRTGSPESLRSAPSLGAPGLRQLPLASCCRHAPEVSTHLCLHGLYLVYFFISIRKYIFTEVLHSPSVFAIQNCLH